MVKTCHLPMLVSESAHRSNPDALERVLVFNTVHLKDHPVFNPFANSLDFVRHGLALFEGRLPMVEILPHLRMRWFAINGKMPKTMCITKRCMAASL